MQNHFISLKLKIYILSYIIIAENLRQQLLSHLIITVGRIVIYSSVNVATEY